MNPFDHRSGAFVEVDGAQLYYEAQGPADAPALLFLHGGFGSIADFNPVMQRLRGHFRAIGVDSRGHGRSTLGRQGLSYERLQRDVLAVTQRLGLDRVSLIGFSDGGIIGYRLAALTPLTIDRLVTIGSHCELRQDDPTRAILAEVTGARWREKFPDSYRSYQALNPQPDFDRFIAAVVEMSLDSSAAGYPGEATRDVRSDTLVVRGDDDHLFSRANALEVLERIPQARLFNIPGAGHSAFAEQPEIFALGVNAFLDGGPG